MEMKKMRLPGALLGLCLFVALEGAHAFSNFTNYRSVIKVNDIIASNGEVWVATSGGLFYCDLIHNAQYHYSDGECFPDLNLTALARDSKGNLWIGTKRGYLYKRTPTGACTIYNSYFSSNWEITDVVVYNNYIIVGSLKGCSIFDAVKGVAVRNANKTDSTGDPAVYALAVHKDSLYAGVNKGYNALSISGSRILNIDKAKWTSVATGERITSFIDSSGAFVAASSPAAMVGSVFYHAASAADSSFILADTDTVYTVNDKITMMSVEDGKNLWFGTEQNFLYGCNAGRFFQIRLNGFSMDAVFRIHAAKNGTTWMLSGASDKIWWQGICGFDGTSWNIYNHFTVPSMGGFAGGDKAYLLGLCEDRDGNIWVGTPGSFVKRYDVKTQKWSVYYITGFVKTRDGLFGFDSIAAVPQDYPSWGQHDAIAADSSGYVWFSNYDPRGVILTGPLVCYDPYGRNATNCRRFFPKDDAHYAVNLTSICVDSKGKILVGASGSRLLVVSHDGNPIKNGVTVVREETNIDVSKMSAGPDGITWIATGKGLYRYQSDSNTIRLTSVQKPVNSVAAENERIVWLGTPSDGLIRYDVVKEDTMTVGINSGLVSNSVTDLSIDHKGGYLWVATAEGVSRYYLGHSNTPVSGNASIVAFPNPFSQSNPRHRMIIFKHCSPDARVLVYSMSGALVAKLSRETSSFNSLDDNMFESTLCWTPPKKLTPGVYYFVGAGQKPVATKKLFIIP